MRLRVLALAVLLSGTASADSLPPQTIRPPGTSATAAQAVQGVTGGVAVPISGSVTVSSAAVTQSTSPWVTADNHTTAAGPLSCELSDGAAFYTGAKTGQLPAALDGSGFLKTHEQGTATVGGTVAVSNAFCLDATLTGGTQQAQVKSGAKGASAAALVTSTANGADHQGLDVQVQNASVAVTQATGTNLHAVLDTTSTTACTQATGTNLHAVLDTTSTTAVTQATGTNLHAVLDTTSTTACTQATAANLNATVVLAAGSALAGKVGIDQTTMGTTNGVVPMPTTVAGAALSQKVFTANTALNIKASAGNVYGWSAINAAAAVCWLQFYNTSGTPTCGTSVIWSVPLPVTPGVSNFVPANLPLQNHATGIAICVSTTATGATTCGSTASGTIFYQ